MQRSTALLLFVLLALLGAADGVYLTLVHLDYETGQDNVAGACHALSAAGCSVTAGRFGAIAGVPVATIGAAGALTMAVLGVVAWLRRGREHDAYRGLLWVLATFCVGVSGLMAVLSFTEGSFCPFCVGWYGINVGLWLTAWRARDPGQDLGRAVRDVWGRPALAAGALAAAFLSIGTLLHHGVLASRMEAHERELQAHAPALGLEIAAELRNTPPKTIDGSALPVRTSASAGGGPRVVIVEFGDFECPHCRKMWEAIEEYVAETKFPVELRFANFPLDSSCNPLTGDLHPHACDAAKAAICAQAQDEFWAYGDLLFTHQSDLAPDDLVRYAENVGLDLERFGTCMGAPETLARIRQDIALGEAVELQATPTLFIDGHELRGALPAPILHAALDAFLGERSAD